MLVFITAEKDHIQKYIDEEMVQNKCKIVQNILQSLCKDRQEMKWVITESIECHNKYYKRITSIYK